LVSEGLPLQSPILTTTITLERLAKREYESMLDRYFKVAPQLNEPLYTRPRAEHKKTFGECFSEGAGLQGGQW